MKIFKFIAILLLLVSCKQDPKNTNSDLPITTKFSHDIEENAVIYELNVRQYSTEGTFEAFTKDIPQLKELGVKIIWVMPIFPISKTKRKATGGPNGKFVDEMPKEEQSNYLGSYYAVSDFRAINPEFGTLESFRDLVNTAHQNGMFVILDWVPNHTGWDHQWITLNPDYYTKDAQGNITHPEGTDWYDVADLNYDNPNMRAQMITDMAYWVTQENIDGFRCDVAGSVPLDFWQVCIAELRSKKNIFMLAEAWEPQLLAKGLFDMCYAWDGHHLINDIAKGKKGVADFHQYMTKISDQYPTEAILMNFVDNHDENSWNGTTRERLGEAEEMLTALTYTMPGMPLIYSGNEYGLDHRLKFFEKDEIPKTKGKHWQLRAKLGELKNQNKALNGGKNAASYQAIETNNPQVLMFKRQKEEQTIYFIANYGSNPQTFKVPLKGKLTNYLDNKTYQIEQEFTLKSWEYLILI